MKLHLLTIKSKKGKEIGIEHLYNNTLINLASACQKAEEK